MKIIECKNFQIIIDDALVGIFKEQYGKLRKWRITRSIKQRGKWKQRSWDSLNPKKVLKMQEENNT